MLKNIINGDFMDLELERFALNFDLFQDKLIQLGFNNPVTAYGILGDELKKFGFEKRQQSSWLSKQPKRLFNIYPIVKSLSKHLEWLPSCVNHFTATVEDGVLDLKPYIREEMTKKEFIDLENTKHPEQEKEQRAIHFDLSMKAVDEMYKYRSKPYRDIKKAMEKNGFFHQQFSGYITKEPISVNEFADRIANIVDEVPNLPYIIKHADATYLKDEYDLTPFIKDQAINESNSSSFVLDYDDNKKLALDINRFVKSEIKKIDLIDKTFEYENKKFRIADIMKVQGKAQADAIIQDIDSNELYLEKNFAGMNPFKLSLNKASDAKLNMKKQSKNIME